METSEATPTPTPTPAELSFRGRIFYPWKGGYEARTALELDMRAAIGAILNKRHWWLKWRAHDDKGVSIRDKWLGEFERKLIADVLERETHKWRPWWLEEAIPRMYAGFPTDGRDEEKQAFVKTVCATIPYNLIWHRDECKQLSRGPDDATAEAAIRNESPEAFLVGNESMQSWGQITWYFELVLLNKTLRAIPWNEWQPPQRVRVGSKHAVARALALLLAVRRGDVTKATFAQYAPDGDHRPMLLDALWLHVDRILQELGEIRDCITNSLEKEITVQRLEEKTADDAYSLSPGPVQETWFSDFLVPDVLKQKFIKEVAALENVPDDQKDWHPESNNQVLDLIHPSLYCGVFGKTKCVAPTSDSDESTTSGLSVQERTQRMLFSGAQLVENAHRGEAKYQWIPSDVAYNDEGDVQFLSYINNLHPEKHRGMYESITHIFDMFTSMLDAVLSCLRTPHGPYPEMDYERKYDQNEWIPLHPPIPETLKLHTPRTPFTLYGKTAQVIVKIATIQLTPENPTYPGGSWHVEGSDAEQIVATCIYYFGCENITESKLSFRVIVEEPRYNQDDRLGMRAMYGLVRDERLVQHLGSVTALEDRCVVFPNTLQHRVEPFELADKTKPGVRKILAFFVVDPSKKIPSTATIPPQQADWIREGLDPVLSNLQHAKALPEGVLDKPVEGMLGVDHGMTLDEAKQHRLALMDERKPSPEQENHHELFFSLCEH